MFRKFALILVLVSCTSHAQSLMNLFNARYCEILLFEPWHGVFVYNTLKQNSCPNQLWSQLSTDEIKKKTAAFHVYKNGPRYWVIDGMEHSSLVDQTVLNINGFKLNKAATLSTFDFLKFILTFQRPYYIHQIKRKTTWVYESGRQIYEIIDDKNHVYVMQSYSTQHVPQTIDDLASLGGRLHLPKDWKFKTGTLLANQYVKAIDGLADIIQDDFYNTYQRAEFDLIQD
ncbi:MAG: hypothetical protein QG556_703 [Pseudomonadota bacterium]|nr:hypothetical protein [Pseudomonadota bacterium]